MLDGDTIYISGERVAIAGMEAPRIQGARCDAERSHGIDAAIRLADLLNSGNVTVSTVFRDDYGRDVRKVKVKGHEVRNAMIDLGVARRYDGKNKGWC